MKNREQKKGEKRYSLKDVWDDNRKAGVHVTGSPEEESRRLRQKTISMN